jgi:hypothetical protein
VAVAVPVLKKMAPVVTAPPVAPTTAAQAGRLQARCDAGKARSCVPVREPFTL